jgi:hypothetical protein
VLVAKPLIETELVIVDTIPQIGGKIATSLAKELNMRFGNIAAQDRLLRGVRFALEGTIKASPTYNQLITPGTELYHEIGLLGGKEKLDQIIDVWSNSVNMYLSRFHQSSTYGVSGTIHIWGVQNDFSDVLDMPAATFLSSNMAGEQTDVPWLEWLLLRGRSFVVPGYTFARGPQYAPWSRTGDGIMLKIRKNTSKQRWQVPSAHSGTESNNWVTRAIYGKDGGPGIEPRLQMLLNRHLQQG